jgi:ATP-dependent protease Clp ATPase subunit
MVSRQHPAVECSFCRATVPANSGHAVAGPTVFICRDCIGLCMEVMDTNDPEWFDQKVKAIKAAPEMT